MRMRRPLAIVMCVLAMLPIFIVVVMGVRVGVRVRVRVRVMMVMPVFMFMGMRMPMTFDRGLTLSAAAYRAHHSTSSSLIFISSPAVTCNW